MTAEPLEQEIRPPRDEHGNRFIDDYEKQKMREEAVSGSGRLSFRGETPRDWVCRAAGVDPAVYVDDAAVEAELRSREEAGQPLGGDVRDQLEALHRYANVVSLDFTRQEYDPAAGEVRRVTDYDKLGRFQRRLQAEASMRSMGPGSGIAMFAGDGWMGDPEVVGRIQRAEAEQAEAQALAQARLDVAGQRFGGPYNIFGSVG